MKLSIIVAVADNGVIGRANALPWRLPDDLKRFKRLTMGHTLIMGRKTFEAIGRPLPGRRMIVLTRNSAFRPAGATVAPDLAAALAMVADEEEAFIVGGADVYHAALPHADRIYLTRVHATVTGDVTFRPLDNDQWELIDAVHHPADTRHRYAFTFEEHRRRGKPD